MPDTLNHTDQKRQKPHASTHHSAHRQQHPVPQILLGLYHVGLAVILFWFLYSFWPTTIAFTDGKPVWSDKVFLGPDDMLVPAEQRLLIIVMLCGAIGSFIHSATSFASYAGNRSLRASWAWWYVLRVPIGSALGILLYFVVRGGFLGATADATNISPYGVAAIAGLAGMFSKQAVDKLREVFDTLFKTTEDDLRGDKPDDPAAQADSDADAASAGIVAGSGGVIGNGISAPDPAASATGTIIPDSVPANPDGNISPAPATLPLVAGGAPPAAGANTGSIAGITVIASPLDGTSDVPDITVPGTATADEDSTTPGTTGISEN